jgi:hypothetical protein
MLPKVSYGGGCLKYLNKPSYLSYKRRRPPLTKEHHTIGEKKSKNDFYISS